jgi:hypothetical protein
MSKKRVLLLLVCLPLLVAGTMMYSSEQGGEVVTLRTYNQSGYDFETSLWIIDDHRTLYLRSGDPNSGWLGRIYVNRRVELVRDETVTAYNAVPVPELRDRINYLMAERYGWADQLIGFMADRTKAVPVRLERIRD